MEYSESSGYLFSQSYKSPGGAAFRVDPTTQEPATGMELPGAQTQRIAQSGYPGGIFAILQTKVKAMMSVNAPGAFHAGQGSGRVKQSLLYLPGAGVFTFRPL